MLIAKRTNQFKKDYKLMEKRHTDMAEIIEEEPLPAHCRPHGLSGSLKGLIDCHVRGDLVLIYEYKDDEETIVFHSIGAHSDLF